MQIALFNDARPSRKPKRTAAQKSAMRNGKPVLPSSWKLPQSPRTGWLRRWLSIYETGRFLTILWPMGAAERLFPSIPPDAHEDVDAAVSAKLWPPELLFLGWPYSAGLLFHDGGDWTADFPDWSAPIGADGPQMPALAIVHPVEVAS